MRRLVCHIDLSIRRQRHSAPEVALRQL